jgi:spore germination protein GerM
VRKKVLILFFIALVIGILAFLFTKEDIHIRLYIYNPLKQALESKDINIKVTRLEKYFVKEKIYKEAINRLISYSDNNIYHLPIPKGTKVLNISVKNNIAYVDFSDELRKNHPGGSLGEMLTVYSIVDTLTEFPEIKKVQILISGAVVETLVGHIDLTSPLDRDLSLVK